MDFSAKLEKLQTKANETVAAARAAAAENREQLKQRIDKAQNIISEVIIEIALVWNAGVTMTPSIWHDNIVVFLEYPR